MKLLWQCILRPEDGHKSIVTKYHIGRLQIGAPKAFEHCNSSSWISPNPKKADFMWLICRPEKSANKSNKVDRFLASSKTRSYNAQRPWAHRFGVYLCGTWFYCRSAENVDYWLAANCRESWEMPWRVTNQSDVIEKLGGGGATSAVAINSFSDPFGLLIGFLGASGS